MMHEGHSGREERDAYGLFVDICEGPLLRLQPRPAQTLRLRLRPLARRASRQPVGEEILDELRAVELRLRAIGLAGARAALRRAALLGRRRRLLREQAEHAAAARARRASASASGTCVSCESRMNARTTSRRDSRLYRPRSACLNVRRDSWFESASGIFDKKSSMSVKPGSEFGASATSSVSVSIVLATEVMESRSSASTGAWPMSGKAPSDSSSYSSSSP